MNWSNISVTRDTNPTPIILPFASCLLIDLPPEGLSCSSSNNSVCIKCNVLGKFFSGESVNEYFTFGQWVTTFIGTLTVVTGVFGTLANLLIICILRRHKTCKVFDTMLKSLAFFDSLCSAGSVISALMMLSYYRNWGRGWGVLETFSNAHYFALFARSGSSFTTVLIAFERYLVVRFPDKARHWFTRAKTKIAVVCVAIFSLLMGIPRFSTYAGKVPAKDIPAVMDVDYLILGTPWGHFWYGTMKGFFNQIDFWVPLPLLLLLNGLIYLEVLYGWGKVRCKVFI